MTSSALSIPTLRTARLTLRAPVWADFETYADYSASDRAAHVGGPYTRGQAYQQFCAIIGHWHFRGFGLWLVADRETDTPLGVVGPYYPEDWPEKEIAWTVFGAAEGRGIAFEAALAAREYAYTVLGWTAAISCVPPENRRSAALARRLGAVRDGVFAHPYGPLDIWRHPAPQEAAQ